MNNKNSLLKILLVDDEPFIRKGLSSLIDWEAEGYCISKEAENGMAAIELLKNEEFDLILSDIKMPEMDGIGLIKYVKKNKLSDAKFVFLSGFYEFKYAKTAIQYDCRDYILKPIQIDELLTTLRNIMKEYQKEVGLIQNNRAYEKAYLDRNLMALVWGKYDGVNLKYVQDNMELSEELTYVHVEMLLNDKAFIALPEGKKREQQRRLYANSRLLLKKQSDHVIFDVTKDMECYDIGLILCDYMPEEKQMSQEEWLSWFLKNLTNRIGYQITAYVGSKVNGIEYIAASYRDACVARFFCLYQKQDNKLWYAIKKNVQVKHPQEKYYKRKLDNLIHGIEINDKTMIRQDVKSFYGHMMDKDTASELIGLNINYFLYSLLGLAYEQEPNINQEEVMHYIRDGVFSFGALQGNEIKFTQFAEAYADYLMQLRQSNGKGIISQIESEIEDHYADNLSLKLLSEKYYLNCAYLGQVFKKQYGCSFKDYLNGVRVRKAAEILLRTDEKVYEVAEKVGYRSLEYFILKFQNVYGVTPTRFRKKYMS